MIIRTTFNDNDFTQKLENYWNGFWFHNYYLAINIINTETVEGLKEYRDRKIEAEDLLEKIFYHEKEVTEKELEIFKNIIKESILAYLKLSSDYEYLKDRIEISIKKSIEDLDENGEVVYYFLKHKKYIVM